jgi:serine/threonine protein kinase
LLDHKTLEACLPGLSVIGHPKTGGQRTILRASLNGKDIVVKIMEIPKNRTADPIATQEALDTVRARLEREIKILSACGHPNIVRPAITRPKYHQDDMAHYLIYAEDYIDGDNLADVFQRGLMTATQAARLAREISSAIEALHERGFLHRDVKPANIIERRSDQSNVLVDLGYAFDFQDASLSGGLFPGTFSYFSPERFDFGKRNLDHRSDFFALGIVLYEGLTGRHPFYFPGILNDALAVAICREEPKEFSELGLALPPAVEQMVWRLLRKHPHQRFRTAGEIEQSLKGI